ncbi:MAG: zinc-binding dehydrogenase [Alphaproteobacteria bacterium]|nr:zinc-binding dehydrogenase [Alphaproteobacteria bacterium]
MPRRWTLARRPVGLPQREDFALRDEPSARMPTGGARIRVTHFSVDPGMRSRLSGDSYAAALPLGETIESAGVGRVIESENPKLPVDATVTGGFGWREEFVTDGKGVMALDPALFSGKVTTTAAIGVLGVPGLTAYFGLLDLGKPKAGDVLLVSSAAGPVGATAGQLAKLLGLTVIGIAGSPTKCAYLKEIGFDHAINYRDGDLSKALRAAAPEGVDIYFDNVGGEMLDRAIAAMKPHGRIVISGQVAEYNAEKPIGIRNVTRFITHRLTMAGLVVYDYRKQFPGAMAALAEHIQAGRLSYREDISAGIETAPEAFIGLFKSENFGRRLIAVV